MKTVRAGAAALLVWLLAACGGSDEPKQHDALACPAGQVRLDAGCMPIEQAASDVRTIVAEAIDEYGLKSVIVDIGADEVPLLKQAWGESMTGVPATPRMHFRNGAVAIAYLGTLLLLLEEDGVLQRGDKLARWFTQYPNADRVTLEMLVYNTSGYPDYVTKIGPLIAADPFHHWTTEEQTELAFSQPLICEPGACFSYAHTNYVILGEVLSKATGREVAELLREHILKPLALEHTRSEDTAVIPEPVLHAYDAERGSYEDSTYWDPSWTLARGAIMTTNIEDLRRSAVAIGEGKLLSATAHAAMLAPTLTGMPPNTPELYYGFGVIVSNGWVMQNPSFHGYSAVMAYLPSLKLSIAITTTSGPDTPNNAVTNRLFLEIAKCLAGPQAPLLPGI